MTGPGFDLAAHLTAVTGQDWNRAAGRDRPTPTRCPRCAAPTLVGLDSSIAALSAVVDPWPVNPAGEVAALLTGRATYRLHPPPRPTLRHRDRWQIAGQPAGAVTVVADHLCGHPLATPPHPHPPITTQEADHVPF